MKKLTTFLTILILFIPLKSQESQLKSVINITSTQMQKLKNGVPLVLYRDSSSNTTVIRFFFKGGRFEDPEGQGGMNYALGRMVSSFQQDSMVKSFMESGSELSVEVEGDFTVITLKCLTCELETTVKTVARMIMKPIISNIRLGSVIKSMKRALRTREDNPYIIMENKIMEGFFKAPGYGGTLFGNMESLDNIDIGSIKDHYNRSFTVEELLITAASDMEPQKLHNILDGVIGSYSKKCKNKRGRAQVRGVEKEVAKKVVVIKRNREQALISCSFRIETPDKKTFCMMSLFQGITGKGIGSKLWALREPLNLAYDVNVKLHLMRGAGVMNCYFSTSMENWKRGLKEFISILNSMKKEGVTLKELEEGKKTTGVSFLKQKESKDMKTYLLGMFEILGLGFGNVQTYHQEINKIGLEEFNNFLKSSFSKKNMIYIIIGPDETSVLKEI